MATEARDPATVADGAAQIEHGAATSAVARLGGAVARYGHGLSFVGMVFALGFFCLSLTPSLLPRAWAYQALVSGFSTAAGYGLGTLVGWATRAMGFTYQPPRRAARISWRVLAGCAAVLVPLYIVLGAHWQDRIRVLFSVEPGARWLGALQAIIALAVAVLLLQTARALRWLVALVARQFARVVPPPLARLVAVVTVVFLIVQATNGTVVRFANDRFNEIYSLADSTTPAGIVQPTAPERSGSSASLSDWETLGMQGRRFTGGGPTLAELSDFVASGDVPGVQEAIEPIRVYAGMQSGQSLEELADLVVAELDRTDAWSRDLLVVATSTGTGWIDPAVVAAIELLHGGNTAIASMQYSYLPSWISFISDRATPLDASKALFEAVYDAWQSKPEGSRPQLTVFGLSLGAYGSQDAFSGLQDIQERTEGAVWAGTPNFTELWSDLTARRDPGSLQRAPEFDEGWHVRWGTTPRTAADMWDPPREWEDPRVVYLQHASDPVVWWSPDLILEQPDWLVEQRGPEVLGEVRWYPVVTFLQITMDLLVAGDTPRGFGHMYQGEYAEAWAAVAPPDGWTDADTDRLRTAVAAVGESQP